MGTKRVVYTPEQAQARSDIKLAAVDLAAYLHGYGARVSLRRVTPQRGTVSVRAPRPQAQPVAVEVRLEDGAPRYSWTDRESGGEVEASTFAEVRDELGVRVRRPGRVVVEALLALLAVAALAGLVALTIPAWRHLEYMHPVRTVALGVLLAGAAVVVLEARRVRRRVTAQAEFAVRMRSAKEREQLVVRGAAPGERTAVAG
ncbi:hypothetical protein CLV28_0979 [Sediminihabitans luteus]|uniref:Uncharacterized protein n=1 Tax=Sediminihabitans luteus TaxID=1138585 RepID=A0A2M9D0Y6_9CELL|nr:hypothetical protein [Sediminihabitans luteus]PJJ77753.1 hypothetical protein CLV28_0979 [Sediminihabitans luteus]GIJ00020.1 hypothetical protein Slu03_23970 [Sediminihabitans luteus]